MKSNILVFSLIVIFIATSCSQEKKFKVAKSGLEYLFHERKDDTRSPKVGEIIKLNFRYSTPSDSVLFEGPFSIRVDPPSHLGGCIEEAFLSMHEGDSASFKIDLQSFYSATLGKLVDFPTKKGDKLRFDIRLIKIMTEEEIKAEEKAKLDDLRANESMLLNEYLKNNNITKEPEISGLYYIEDKAGTGKPAQPGKKVTVHYTGRKINGEIFDSSLKREKPIEFVLGTGQVIPGWEEGISKMKENGKATLIIPSHLAYGEAGAGKIILPFSTLIFDIELIKVE